MKKAVICLVLSALLALSSFGARPEKEPQPRPETQTTQTVRLPRVLSLV